MAQISDKNDRPPTHTESKGGGPDKDGELFYPIFSPIRQGLEAQREDGDLLKDTLPFRPRHTAIPLQVAELTCSYSVFPETRRTLLR